MPKKGENIYKRKDGRWEGRYIRFRNIGGKTEYGYIYGKSYAEVKQKLMTAKAMVQPHNEARGKLPGAYGQLPDDWLHSSKITVKDSTYARYAHLIQKHIKPHLGDLQLSQLTSQIIEEFIAVKLKTGRLDGRGGLAPKTVADIFTLIKSTVAYAGCNNYDKNNVVVLGKIEAHNTFYSISRRADNDLWNWEAPYIKPEIDNADTASSETQDWRSVYMRFVLNRQYEDTDQNYKSENMTRIKFGLHDMDGNGIPELIIHNGAADEADMKNYAYMYKNGSVAYLGIAGSGQAELKYASGSGFHGLFWASGNAGYYPGYCYTVENNTFKSELISEEKVEYYNGRMDYIRTQVTDNTELYYSFRNADSTPELYTLSEIISMGWDDFVKRSLSHDNTLYTDVNLNSWFYDAVKYADEKKMLSGVSDTMFGPDREITRAMFITMLYRLEGEPSGQTVSFKDVPSGSWYEKSVAWASRNNIANGVNGNSFAPDNSITREQLTAILYRYAKYKSKSVNVSDNMIKHYVDGSSVSAYAVDSVNWAIENGLISGTSATRLSPAGKATRAQAAVILQRFCKKYSF